MMFSPQGQRLACIESLVKKPDIKTISIILPLSFVQLQGDTVDVRVMGAGERPPSDNSVLFTLSVNMILLKEISESQGNFKYYYHKAIEALYQYMFFNKIL